MHYKQHNFKLQCNCFYMCVGVQVIQINIISLIVTILLINSILIMFQECDKTSAKENDYEPVKKQ